MNKYQSLLQVYIDTSKQVIDICALNIANQMSEDSFTLGKTLKNLI